ncbi:META domain-containing protein [Methanoregula sp.]|uniref:META domain-containing protein n=1 Tax=Methanoregula sp. TaxID=2052170 RepID=UPI003C24FC7A
MDDEDTGTLTELEDETLPEPAPYLPAPPMSPWFWVAFGLIGILIILIIYGQVQGITHAVTVNLTGTSWTLVSSASPQGVMLPIATMANLSFGAENKTAFGWYDSCNQYSYTYSLNNTALIFSNGPTTPSSCSQFNDAAAESSYLQDLENTTTERFRNGHLTFYDAENKPLLTFDQSGI